MEKIYRIVACLSLKGLHYDIIEVDILKETRDNYILDKATSTGKTKRLPKQVSYGVNVEPNQQGDIYATTWAFQEDINYTKGYMLERIGVQLRKDKEFHEKRAKSCGDLIAIIGSAPVTLKHRTEKEER